MVRCFEVLHGTLNASKQPFVAAVGVVEVVKDFMFEIKLITRMGGAAKYEMC